MGKKILKEAATRRTSSRVIKKKQHPEDLHFYQQEQEDDDHSPHDDSSQDDQEESESVSEEEDSASPSPIQPEKLAIRNMQFRERRGTKMNYLINRKKEEEEDPFWAQQGQQYFGDLDDGDNDEQDYVESSSGRDEFDSDFDQTESEHQGEQVPEQQQRQVDEQHEKEKRRRQDLMRRIEAPALPKRNAAKSGASSKKNQKAEKDEQGQAASRYIHMAFNQQQLLGEAATTEYYNWLSLKKLISIQTERKDFTRRSHHIDGPKVVYRDRITVDGIREETYELQEVEVREVQDLTRIMNQN